MKMNDKEKRIVLQLKEALPKMSDFEKGYLLGMTEKMVIDKSKREKKDKVLMN